MLWSNQRYFNSKWKNGENFNDWNKFVHKKQRFSNRKTEIFGAQFHALAAQIFSAMGTEYDINSFILIEWNLKVKILKNTTEKYENYASKNGRLIYEGFIKLVKLGFSQRWWWLQVFKHS